MNRYLSKFSRITLSILILLSSSAWGEVYVRNKPVTASIERSGTIYVLETDLKRYFRSKDLTRCKFDIDTSEVMVDGNILSVPLIVAEGVNVPILEIAEALGFAKRVNTDLGVVDYIAPSALLKKEERPKRTGGRDYQLAKERMQRAFLKSPEIPDHKELPRVRRIAQEIVAHSDMPSLDWKFFIVRNSTPNAFCCGAGWVAVTDSLLELDISDDELAGLLAHEVGHGCRKDLEEVTHNIGAMKGLRGQVAALQQERKELLDQQSRLLAEAQRAIELGKQAKTALAADKYLEDANSALDKSEKLNGPIAKIEKQIEVKVKDWKDRKEFITASHYKQKDEYDADIKGLYYATKAGYSHLGLMQALTKIADNGATQFGKAAYQGGFSHPPLSERIETMNKVLREWRNR